MRQEAGCRRGGRPESGQREQCIAALEILVDAFLENGTERLPDFGESLRLLVGNPLQFGQDAAGHALSDRGKQRALLNFFTRYIERQIGTIDKAAHEAQIARQDVRIIGDEHALDVKLDAALAIGIEQVERPRAGNEQQRRVILPTLGAVMDGRRRLVELPGDAAIEIRVICGRYLGLRLGPQRRAVADLGRFRARLLDHRDRYRHVAGLRLDQPLDCETLGIGLGIFEQVKRDAGAARRGFSAPR